LVALGIGFAFVTGAISAVAGVEPHEAGLASGLINTSRMFGGALGLALLATIATSRTNHDLRHLGTGIAAQHAALASGFDLAFRVGAGIAIAGALVALIGLPGAARKTVVAQPVSDLAHEVATEVLH
jgi:hypothetical protein